MSQLQKRQLTIKESFSRKQSLLEMVALNGISMHAIAKSDVIRNLLIDRGFHLPKNSSSVLQLVKDHYRCQKNLLKFLSTVFSSILSCSLL